jgi:hypothetical protein
MSTDNTVAETAYQLSFENLPYFPGCSKRDWSYPDKVQRTIFELVKVVVVFMVDSMLMFQMKLQGFVCD